MQEFMFQKGESDLLHAFKTLCDWFSYRISQSFCLGSPTHSPQFVANWEYLMWVTPNSQHFVVWYFILFSLIYSAILYVPIDFHLTAVLLCNVNLCCFYLIRTLLWLWLKDTSCLSVLHFPYFWSQAAFWSEEALLVSSRASLTSSAEVASLSLFGQPSSNGVTIKMPYTVDVLHWPALQLIISYWVG